MRPGDPYPVQFSDTTRIGVEDDSGPQRDLHVSGSLEVTTKTKMETTNLYHHNKTKTKQVSVTHQHASCTHTHVHVRNLL